MPTLQDFICGHQPLLVITGAGISTASGIPAYRDHAGIWRAADPVQHNEFIHNAARRRQYWARSAVGWPRIEQALPNAAHRALASLESMGLVDTLVTQNVDRLHQRCGHRQVIDLHGRLDRVICLDCSASVYRHDFQRRLLDQNPWLGQLSAEAAPDGDAQLDQQATGSVSIPSCENCNGILMPDVVFFGGGIPRQRMVQVEQALQRAAAVLVVGSSLVVYSGYRLCRAASSQGKPLAAINPGQMRGEELFDTIWREDCSETLPRAVQRIAAGPRQRL